LSARHKLASWRESMTVPLTFQLGASHGGTELIGGQQVAFDATFSWDSAFVVREVFASPFKLGTDMRAMVRQFCIDRSVGLQHGASFTEILPAMGEDDPRIPPRSIFGAICRAGAQMEADLMPFLYAEAIGRQHG